MLFLAACTPHSRPPVADRSAVSPASATATTHTVKKGDSLYAIAWRHQLDYRDLAAANGISDPYTIYPGDVIDLRVTEGARLRVPSSAPTQSPRTATNGKQAEATQAQRARVAARPASPTAKTPARAVRTRPTVAATAPKSRAATLPQPTPVRAGASRGWRHPVGVRPTQAFGGGNLGQDYLLTPGAKVYSASGGVVMYAGPGLGGFRHLVIVKASNQYLAAYGLNVAPVVREGEAVQPGQVLAAIEGDGALSRRFHFEVRRDGKPVDPKPLIGS